MFKTALAHETWKSKYRFGEETPLQTFQRVAKALASVEKNPDEWYDKFLGTLVRFSETLDPKDLFEGASDRVKEYAEKYLIPVGLKNTMGGRITANVGTTFKKATLLNCFIGAPVSKATISYTRETFDGSVSFPVNYVTDDTPDDLINIFLTIAEQAKTLASEGGYGINFDFIRPRGSLIKGTGVKHPGVVSYMSIWDAVSACIVQGDMDGYVDKIKNHLKEKFDEVKDIVKSMPRKGAMLASLSCVSGDTLISTVNGKIPIKDLEGKNPYIYCTDGNTNIFIRQAQKVWKTGKRKTVKILFDDDSHLICTPDHLIMLANGSYKEAGQLSLGDSISAFHKVVYMTGGKYTTNGYYRVGVTGSRNAIPEHVAMAELKYGYYPKVLLKKNSKSYMPDSQVVHHIDGNSLNNNPENIEIITHLEHVQRHKSDWINYFDSCRDSLSKIRKGKTWDEFYGYQQAQLFKERAKKGIKERRTGSWNKGLTGDSYKGHFKEGFKNQFNDEIRTWDAAYGEEKATQAKIKKTKTLRDNLGLANHKVISVTEWSEMDVYDITVPEFHNFVANDIFVHNCDHPDCEEFIRAKQQSGQLTKFNISVVLTDKFLQAVEANELFDQTFNGVAIKRIKARDLYNLIMESCYNRAEPGVLYADNMMKNNPIAYLGKVKTTNPCGEIGGLDTITTVCLLGSTNLTQYVKIKDRTPYFDFEEYARDIQIFMRMLDNVNDLTYSPLPSYAWVVENLRQVGMGINGLGSTLMMLGMPYSSPEAVEFTKTISQMKENLTWQVSALLAKEKGPFPAYDKAKFEATEYFNSDRITEETKDLMRKYGVRNAKTTTCPPLGNSSVISDLTSNGIEPVFLIEYERKVICKEWPEGLTSDNVQTLLEHHKEKDYEYWAGDYKGKRYYYEPHNRGLCEISVVRDYGYQWLLDNYPGKEPERYKGVVTTKDLKIEDHLNIQSMVQYYNNQSTSKTLNLPQKFPFEDFKELYLRAWKAGLNGFTTYRDGSMESVLSGIAKAEKREIVAKDIKLPTSFINGPMQIIKREGKKFYLHFSYLPEDSKQEFPIVLWIHTNAKYKAEAGELKACNKAARNLAKLALGCGVDSKIVKGSLDKANEDYPHNRLGRLVSLNLRHNVPREDILVALMGIDGDNISTLLTAVRKFLSKTLKDGVELKGLKCPTCGGQMVMDGGCSRCLDCGGALCQ